MNGWHLFYVEAATCRKAWLVSAASDSQTQAEELARAAVDDTLPEGACVSHSRFVCIADRDIFEEIGGIAS